MKKHARRDPGSQVVLKVADLKKSYGETQALRGVSFEVHRGEIFTLLGPNGSGKTTTLEIIEGIRRYDGGEVFLLGALPGSAAVKERIGVMLQSSELMGNWKPLEALKLFRSFYERGLDPEECVERLGLAPIGGRRIKNLSHGEKAKLQIGLAIINDPAVVFLDEPTSGLDPISRRHIWGILQSLRARDVTLVLTTHYMEEAQQLCDRVAMLKEGRIIADDTPQACRLVRSAEDHRALGRRIRCGFGHLSQAVDRFGQTTLP